MVVGQVRSVRLPAVYLVRGQCLVDLLLFYLLIVRLRAIHYLNLILRHHANPIRSELELYRLVAKSGYQVPEILDRHEAVEKLGSAQFIVDGYMNSGPASTSVRSANANGSFECFSFHVS